jgi:threonine aldolase
MADFLFRHKRGYARIVRFSWPKLPKAAVSGNKWKVGQWELSIPLRKAVSLYPRVGDDEPFCHGFAPAGCGGQGRAQVMINLASDNVVGASRPVLEALIAANDGAAAPYGTDPFSAKATELLSQVFEREVQNFMVATGTGANALALAALTPPWGAVFCHAESHVMDDECGAPEMFTDGAKIVGVPGANGKMTIAALEHQLARFGKGVVKSVQPAALSISQVTEAGTIYTLDEIRTFTAFARKHGLKTHLDGARFTNAMLALGCTAAEMTWKAGIDVVTFGASKNGCLACEAVIFFDPALAENFQYRRKRGGHTLSKGRLLGAQMIGYLENDHWIKNATHANAMAQKLAQGLRQTPGARLPWPVDANEVFVVVPLAAKKALDEAEIRAAPWSSNCVPDGFTIRDDEAFLRFVTSFATKAEEVDAVLAVVAGHRAAAE